MEGTVIPQDLANELGSSYCAKNKLIVAGQERHKVNTVEQASVFSGRVTEDPKPKDANKPVLTYRGKE